MSADPRAVIAAKWTAQVICALIDGPKGYRAILREVPNMPEPTLSVRLRQLELAGVIARHVENGRPPVVAYSLTDKGRELEPILSAIDEWARRPATRRSLQRRTA